jgi:hypothetical protein
MRIGTCYKGQLVLCTYDLALRLKAHMIEESTGDTSNQMHVLRRITRGRKASSANIPDCVGELSVLRVRSAGDSWVLRAWYISEA